MGLIVDGVNCGRGIRAPTNLLWGLGLQGFAKKKSFNLW
jgi:hypothetical protein